MRVYGWIAVGLIVFACQAQAAVTVLSGGAARNCFEAARFDGAAAAGIATCSDALDSDTLTGDDRAATLVNRGILRVRLSDFKDALSDYDQALVIRPELAEAYVNRGAVLIKSGQYKEAIADLSKGLALGSQSADIALYDRGQARERTGDLSGACADYRQALALNPIFDAAQHRANICAVQVGH